MKTTDSIWTKADKFLSLIRKVFLNTFTIIFIVFLTFGIFGFLSSSLAEKEVITEKENILWFKPVGVLVDSKINQSPGFESLLGDAGFQQHELKDLLKVLNHAADDEEIEVVYINVSELAMYYASAFEIANAVMNLRANNKRVISYAEYLTNTSYLINSQADQVFINNNGIVGAFGFTRKREYYKDLYENINLNYHVFIAGDFKTGPEPFTRDNMSDEDKQSWNEFANPIWKKMTDMMESSRNLTKGTIQSYGDNFWFEVSQNPERAQIALDYGLVDGIYTEEKLRNWMFKEFPNDDKDKMKYPDSISIYEYLNTIENQPYYSENKIAIINVEGEITFGESIFGVAGSDTIVKNIRKAIKDDSVKAMVLRVNSPGGIVDAGELITNALEEFKNTDRPIITSMGDIAASGGVWVTTLSEEIWAQPETLTGSIGVYALATTIDGIYDWAGIKVDGISSTKAAEWDPRQPMPNYIKESIQASVDNTYDKFIRRVADNRKMPYQEVLSAAGGRIWSGEKALQLGLIDKLGNVNDAIDSAAEIANLNEYVVETYSKELDPFEAFLVELINELDIKILDDSNLNKIRKFLNTKYKFIDHDKEINEVAYCFECDFFKLSS